MNRMKVVYVAGPFRGETAWRVAENIRAAERVGMKVAELGAMPLIPHANTANFDGTMSDRFWIDGTAELLLRCDALVTTERWRASSGAVGEVELAHKHSIPVFHTLGDLGWWLRDCEQEGTEANK